MRTPFDASVRALVLSALCVAAVPLFTAGCVDPARQRSEQAVGTLTDTRATLVRGRKQIDDVVATIGLIEARPADLNKPYATYKSQVADIQATAAAVRSRVQDMRVRAATYSDAWMNDADKNISDPNLRATAEERNERVKQHYDQIDQQAQEVRAAYDPFITQLKDLETFLANDLTYAAVESSRPMFGTVKSSADNLKAKVDQMLATLDDASTKLSPTTAPTP